MAFIELCEDEPLIRTLREVFKANIVRVPEERIQPLSVLSSKKGKLLFWGNLNSFVTNGHALNIKKSDYHISKMANISGKSTRKVNVNLGLKVLEGFLNGFNLPNTGIATKFDGASTVSFSFGSVTTAYVDIGLLGDRLSKHAINMDNPANAVFFGEDKSDFYVINSVIQSSNFSISVDKALKENFKLDIPSIQGIVAQAGVDVEVSTTTGYDLTFSGSKYLSFAFSCIKLLFDDNGKIISMPAVQKPVSFNLNKLDDPIFEPVLLRKKVDLLEWDKPEDVT